VNWFPSHRFPRPWPGKRPRRGRLGPGGSE
jgi:hypothetical protein